MEGDLVTIGNGGEGVAVPATWLSQGYQSTISWIADIIGQFFYERGESVPCDQMEGLVLVAVCNDDLRGGFSFQLFFSELVKEVIAFGGESFCVQANGEGTEN
jgi:hypothetical protein